MLNADTLDIRVFQFWHKYWDEEYTIFCVKDRGERSFSRVYLFIIYLKIDDSTTQGISTLHLPLCLLLHYIIRPCLGLGPRVLPLHQVESVDDHPHLNHHITTSSPAEDCSHPPSCGTPSCCHDAAEEELCQEVLLLMEKWAEKSRDIQICKCDLYKYCR